MIVSRNLTANIILKVIRKRITVTIVASNVEKGFTEKKDINNHKQTEHNNQFEGLAPDTNQWVTRINVNIVIMKPTP